ncbi:HNH endonuclease [bacterium]|nr:HNH endonuclease [bacterium]
MHDYEPGLSAAVVASRLKQSVKLLRDAERSAVLWFAELKRRRLHRELGYPDLRTFAEKELGFSAAKTYQFIRLADALESLPKLRESVATGALTWTKARTVAAVATPETERGWIEAAERSTSRELEQEVRERRRVPLAEHQPALLTSPAAAPSAPPTSRTLSFTLSAEQHAQALGLLERLRKSGRGESREELLLAAFAALAEGACTRVQNGVPYQLVVYRCEQCGVGRLTDGSRAPDALVEQARCDGRVHEGARPNRSTIPPSRRRQVLARDGHRCQSPGCESTRFLEVHHRVPRSRGGSNATENLVTLCASCHRFHHEHPQAASLLPRAG